MDIDQSPQITDKPLTADVGEQQVAGVYAAALLNAAEKRGADAEVLEELKAVVEKVVVADARLAAFFLSGTIGRDRRAVALRAAFEGRSNELLYHFLMVLNDHERLGLIGPILASYRRLRDRRARKMRVQVFTAVPLADDQRQRLEKEVREALHLEPVLETRVEPDLIGGLIVRANDWVYDGSIRTQLETIRKQLIAKGSHEIQGRRDRFSTSV